MKIAEFLLARIAEDEIKVSLIHPKPHEHPWMHELCAAVHFEAARVTAECEAKRRIVERCAERANPHGDWPDSARWLAEDILSDFASVYADHPDYGKGW